MGFCRLLSTLPFPTIKTQKQLKHDTHFKLYSFILALYLIILYLYIEFYFFLKKCFFEFYILLSRYFACEFKLTLRPRFVIEVVCLRSFHNSPSPFKVKL